MVLPSISNTSQYVDPFKFNNQGLTGSLDGSLGWWLGNSVVTSVGPVSVPTSGPKLKKQTLWPVFVDLNWAALELDIAGICEPGPVAE
jgi:hypothetical protein